MKYIEGKLAFVLLIVLSLLTVACSDVSEQQVLDIVKSHPDYSEFKKYVPDFKPDIVNITKISSLDEDFKSKLQGLESYLDKIKLTDSTYLVEIFDKDDDKNSLLAVIDYKKKETLLIVHNIGMEVGI